MKKDPVIFLKHILESINDAEEFIRNFSESKFKKSKKTQKALIKQVEIIGEAARNLPKEFVEKYKEVPWSDIIRTRDKLIHGYFGVNLETVWDVVKNKLPILKKQIKEILKKENS